MITYFARTGFPLGCWRLLAIWQYGAGVAVHVAGGWLPAGWVGAESRAAVEQVAIRAGITRCGVAGYPADAPEDWREVSRCCR